MSNIIPPLVSSSPPPMALDDEEDDDFGDFTMANDFTYDGLSLPTTPQHSSITSRTYQELPFTTNEVVTNVKEQVDVNDVKDNTSQDSVVSTVTSDSGMSSERVLSSGEDTSNFLDDAKNNCIAPSDTLEESHQNTYETLKMTYTSEKDYQDVRNIEATVIEKDEDAISHNSGKQFHFDEPPPVEVIENHYNDFNDIVINGDSHFDDISCARVLDLDNDRELTKDYKDKRKLSYSVQDMALNTENNERCSENIPDVRDEIECSRQIITDDLVPYVSENHTEEITPNIYVDEDINVTSAIEPNNIDFEQCTDDNFASFESAPHQDPVVENNEEFDDDDFGDFTDFAVPPPLSTIEEDTSGFPADDSDEFCEFSSAISKDNYIPSTVVGTEKTADEISLDIVKLFSKKPNPADSTVLSKTIQDIFHKTFPPDSDNERPTSPPISASILHSFPMWTRLEDIENTKALKFRWENSNAYSAFLRVLNMDTRNILYGPNLNMPRFAANLGGTPLEPLKPVQPLIPTPVPTTAMTMPSTTSGPSGDGLVPMLTTTTTTNSPGSTTAVQFDWSDSGLINPLDFSQNGTMLLDLDGLVHSLEKFTGDVARSEAPVIMEEVHQLRCEILDIDTWKFWTQGSVAKDEEPSNTSENEKRTLPALEGIALAEKKLVDMASLEKSSIVSEKTPSSLHLPDLPPEENTLNEEIRNVPLNNLSDDDDEFTNFHSSNFAETTNWKSNDVSANKFGLKLRETHISAPPDINANQYDSKESVNNPAWFQPTILTPELARKSIPEAGVPVLSSKHGENDVPVDKISKVEEDDFSDFQSVPITTTKPMGPTLSGTLQPIVVETSGATAMLSKLEINWPDPGISADELNRLSEINFQAAKPEADNGQPEDDWSDFVSVNAPTKVQASVKPSLSAPVKGKQKVALNFPTAQEQPAPSPSRVKPEEIFSELQSYSSNSKHLPNPSFESTTLQPQPVNYHVKAEMLACNSLSMPPPAASDVKTQAVDDDWSEFVSNRDSSNQFSNGWCQQQPTNAPRFGGWNQPPNFTSWNAPSSFTPNIITNPGHFDQCNAYKMFSSAPSTTPKRPEALKPVCVTAATIKNQTHTTLQAMGGRNSVSTISSLPELDFLTPKSALRTKQSKK